MLTRDPARSASSAAVVRAGAAFALSGFAALVDQVVWQRLLALFSGVHPWSITVIVAAYMAGLGFGSLAGGRVADGLTPRSSARLFAACELLVAAFAAASPWLYHDVAYARLGPLVRHPAVLPILHFLLLLLPTLLMGASLPLLARAVVSAEAEIVARRLAWLYAANTGGAAVGAFAATWWLMGAIGFASSLRVAALLNLGAAALALTIRTAESAPRAPERQLANGSDASPLRMWALTYALSGFIALGLEMVWLRVLGTMIKASPYTFGHVIGVLLLALGLGAFGGARAASRASAADAPSVFLVLQWGVTIAAALPILALPVLVAPAGRLAFVFHFLSNDSPLLVPQVLAAVSARQREVLELAAWFWLGMPAALIVPGALMMGASYAWIQRAVQTDVREVGHRTGVVQAANVFGCAAGAVVTGLLLLEVLGTAWTLKLLVGLGGIFGWLYARRRRPRRRPAVLLAAVGLPLGLAASLPGHERLWSSVHGAAPGTAVIVEDGSSVVSMQPLPQAEAVIRVNGIGHSALPYGGAWVMLGVLPVLANPGARTVLIIGMGTGCTPWSSAVMPGVQQVDLYEIARPERQALTTWETRRSHPEVQEFLRHPRIRTTFTDGRLALRLESSRYDVIEADAAEPQMAYSGNLYSLEFFLEARRRLSPGGLLCTYVPSARVAETVKAAFPFVLDIWWGDTRLMLGSEAPTVLSAELLVQRLQDPDVRARLGATPRGAVLWKELLEQARSVKIVRIGPDDPRSANDINTDLFPRDEFDWRLDR